MTILGLRKLELNSEGVLVSHNLPPTDGHYEILKTFENLGNFRKLDQKSNAFNFQQFLANFNQILTPSLDLCLSGRNLITLEMCVDINFLYPG